jgi:putative SOS response-associated peptidase YedK
MCGRFAVSSSGEELGSYFDVDELDAYKLAPAWNIKPTQQIPVVLQSAKGGGEPRHRLEQGRKNPS